MVVSKNVQVCQELDAVLAIVVTLVADVKAGKSATDVVNDALPGLVGALGGLGQLSAETANHQAFDNTLALKGVEMKQALLPGLL